MTSVTTEPPTLRSFPPIAATVSQRRSYSCYNCNYSFHITPTAATSPSSPSSFRCPRCHHRHLIPHHTISPPPPPPPPPRPPSDPSIVPTPDSNHSVVSSSYNYHSSDDSDSDDDDYDSDNSLLSFTIPDPHPSTPASKSFVASLPIKNFPQNSSPSLQSCSICMDDFEVNSVTINELPCQHYFHKDCIVEWLQRSNTCPLCRYELPVDSSPKKVIDITQWEEYNQVLVLDLSPTGELIGSRVVREETMSSNVVASGSDREGLSVNGGETSSLDFEAMRDEDGDTLMIDA